MQVKDGFILRRIGDKHVVVPVGERTLDFSSIITLNETGAFLWEQLREGRSNEQLVQALLQEYEVSREQAAGDAARFVKALEEAALLA